MGGRMFARSGQFAGLTVFPNQRCGTGKALLGWPVAGAGRGGLFCFAAVMAPAPHRFAHAQDLVFEFRAGLTCHQMQLQGDVIGQAQRTIFTRDQQGRGLLAGASE